MKTFTGGPNEGAVDVATCTSCDSFTLNPTKDTCECGERFNPPITESFPWGTRIFWNKQAEFVKPRAWEEAARRCICPFGVLRGDCPVHGELVP